MSHELKLYFPDSLYDINRFSFSSFLYFKDSPVTFTTNPTASQFLTGCDPYDFLRFVESSNSNWKADYLLLFKLWEGSRQRNAFTNNLLEPLRESGALRFVWFSYSRTAEMLEVAGVIMERLGIDYRFASSVIDIEHGAQELMAHLHFEQIFELYGSPSITSIDQIEKREVDYKDLFNYCNDLFRKYSFEEALVRAYFFRLVGIDLIGSFLLPNEKLIPLLCGILESDGNNSDKEVGLNDQLDLVACELFRQIVSPYIDSKDPQVRVSLTEEVLRTRASEVQRLKNKCWGLSESFKGDSGLKAREQNVSKYIQVHVEPELRDVLSLERSAFNEVRDKLFADEKTWAAMMAFAISIFTGGELITAGAGLATLSNLLAKIHGVRAEHTRKALESDYSLIYRIGKA